MTPSKARELVVEKLNQLAGELEHTAMRFRSSDVRAWERAYAAELSLLAATARARIARLRSDQALDEAAEEA